MSGDNQSSAAMPDEFDRLMGQLDGTPGLSKTRPSTVTAVPLFGVGGSSRYIVETWRTRHEPVDDRPAVIRDIVFLTIAAPHGYFRHVLPAEVVEAMIRQRDSLATKIRSKIGKQLAAERKARGEVPGFMRGRKKGKKA